MRTATRRPKAWSVDAVLGTFPVGLATIKIMRITFKNGANWTRNRGNGSSLTMTRKRSRRSDSKPSKRLTQRNLSFLEAHLWRLGVTEIWPLQGRLFNPGGWRDQGKIGKTASTPGTCGGSRRAPTTGNRTV